MDLDSDEKLVFEKKRHNKNNGVGRIGAPQTPPSSEDQKALEKYFSTESTSIAFNYILRRQQRKTPFTSLRGRSKHAEIPNRDRGRRSRDQLAIPQKKCFRT